MPDPGKVLGMPPQEQTDSDLALLSPSHAGDSTVGRNHWGTRLPGITTFPPVPVGISTVDAQACSLIIKRKNLTESQLLFSSSCGCVAGGGGGAVPMS